MGFVDRLPASMTDPAYAALVMEYIEGGGLSIDWSTITSDYNGHHAEFYVPTDAFMIEGVRIDVSASLGQQICDLLGCLMLTPKLAELMWYRRVVTLNPVTLVHTRADTQFMATTAWMLKHSRAIDAQLAAQGNPSGLRCTVGKTWVIGKVLEAHPGSAINFGWQNATTGPMCVTPPPTSQPRCHVIQDPGWAHPPSHIDYSQIFLAVRRDCLVDGQRWDVADLLRDSKLAGLASYDGPLKLLRQPGVPLVACKIKIGMNGPPETLDYKGATITIVEQGGVWAAAWMFGAHRGDVQGSSRDDVRARAQAWIDDRSGVCPMPPGVQSPQAGGSKSKLAIGAVVVGVVTVVSGTVWWMRR